MAVAEPPETRRLVAQGSELEIVVTLSDSTGQPLDLTALGFTPVMQLRQDPDETAADATMAAVISGANNEVVTLTLSATDSLALEPGPYTGRLLLQHADPEQDTITQRRYVVQVEKSHTRRV